MAVRHNVYAARGLGFVDDSRSWLMLVSSLAISMALLLGAVSGSNGTGCGAPTLIAGRCHGQMPPLAPQSELQYSAALPTPTLSLSSNHSPSGVPGSVVKGAPAEMVTVAAATPTASPEDAIEVEGALPPVGVADAPGTPTLSASAEAAPSQGDEEPMSELWSSFLQSSGTLLAAVAAIIGMGLLVCVVAFSCRRVPQGPRLRLDVTARVGDNVVAPQELLLAVVQIFAQLRHDLTVLEQGMLLEDIRLLGYMNVEKILPRGVSSGGEPSIKLSVGPLEIGGLERLVSLLLGRREFLLSVDMRSGLASPRDTYVGVTLTLSDCVWYSWQGLIEHESLEETLRTQVHSVVWTMSRKSPEAVGRISGGPLPAELEMLAGIHLLATYLRQPRSIAPLRIATEHFRRAGAAGPEWEFQAALLEAITLQLTQQQPRETESRMSQLRDEYGADRALRNMLQYNLGQARFYLYTAEGYEKAIQDFSEIERPLAGMWRRAPRVWRVALRYLRIARLRNAYRLFCLAQCNISLAKAHQVDRHATSVSPSNSKLAGEVRLIVEQMRQELTTMKGVIGAVQREVEWRLDNAEVVLAFRLRNLPDEEIHKALEAAREALAAAPHALDVKANAGSLNLLLARRHRVRKQEQEAALYLERAEQIFAQLHEMGWEPSFVAYRLGTIRRVQGKYDDAKRLLEIAMAPEINDVPVDRIRDQMAKAENGDASLVSADV